MALQVVPHLLNVPWLACWFNAPEHLSLPNGTDLRIDEMDQLGRTDLCFLVGCAENLSTHDSSVRNLPQQWGGAGGPWAVVCDLELAGKKLKEADKSVKRLNVIGSRNTMSRSLEKKIEAARKDLP